MKSKILKIIFVFAIIFTIFNNYNVQALKDPIDNPNEYRPGGSTNNTALEDKAGAILGVINVVGVVVSVVTMMIIGIKYMVGSVEEKAEYKKRMMTYLVGAVLLFAATTLPNILYRFATTI